jgi:asparagine synthase (glutamine-hydrolysing)
MCGIAGAVAVMPGATPDRDRLVRISQRIAHRGPDADGLWVAPSGRAALAHRRLSVIDLATGQQPMLDRGERVGLVFNGEIYNYREVRERLARRGAAFRTQSDTEVLLRLYQDLGAACVNELRGMFAFAAWDDDAGQLLLARDRIGKKPLYHTIEDGCLYFASTLESLRETARSRWEIDPVAVDALMTLGYIPAPRTIFRSVSKLEAGTTLTADSARVSTHRYWDPATNDRQAPETFAAAVDELDELLNTAVALRLRSDVPLGVFLSGGVDSSLVAAVATRQAATTVSTFSIGFDVATFDETKYAARVAERLGTRHHVFRAHPDLLATLPAMVRHFGEPFADSSALPTWLLAEETRKHVTVALAGDGGDEAFAGYDWYRTVARLRRVTRAIPEAVFATTSRTIDGFLRFALAGSRTAGRVRRGVAMLGVKDGPKRFALLRSFVGPTEARSLYAGELREVRRGGLGESGEHLAALYRSCPGDDLRRLRYVDITTYLADCLMPKVDVATMAHGLEARAPLLDQELMRFALSLPESWLIDSGEGKKILRAVLSRYLPAALFERPKRGFSVPLSSWFAGSMRDRVSSLPVSEPLRQTGWFDPAGIESLVREHITGLRDHSQRLFSLLVLEEWLGQRT